MAIENNSVPLGQAGTGAAFVLGNSQVADQFVNNQARNQQIAYQNQLAKQKLAQEQAALWDKNALKVAGGLYWKPEFDQRSQAHIEKGIQLRQQGINPYAIDYSNPEKAQQAQDYLLERQGILRDDANRKSLETEIGKRFQAIQANPSKYDPEYIQQINKIVESPYSEVSNKPLPEPLEAFNVDRDLVSKLDPVTFQTSKVVGNTKIDENKMLVEPTKRNIETLISDDDKGKRWIKRQTGLTPSEAKNIPDSFSDNKKDLLKQYKGNPDLRASLAAQYGITGEGQELDDLLNQQAQQRVQQKQAYNGIIDQYTEVARGKANEFLKKNPDFRIKNDARADERLKLSREAANRSRIKFSAWESAKKDNGSYEDFLRDAVDAKSGAVDELKGVLAELNGKVRTAYSGETFKDKGKEVKLNGKSIVIDVPEQVTIPVYEDDGKTQAKDSNGKALTEKVFKNKRYIIGRTGGKKAEIVLNQILQKAKGFGALKQQKVLPYDGEEELVTEENDVQDWED